MDELNNGEQGQYVEPGKNEKKNNTRKIVKRTLLTAGLALAVYMVYSIVYLFISPDRNIQQIYLVPEDAAFIIQSSAPIPLIPRPNTSTFLPFTSMISSYIAIRAIRHKIAVIIENTATTLVSDHPHSSK